jgi:predicted XRE-type DNA-binding protein
VSKDRKFSSVWDAIESTPQQAASMRARSELMMALQEWVKAAGKTQAAAAKLFGVTQPRMSDLMRGRLHLFSLETLMDMATTAGMEPHIAIKRRMTKQKHAVDELAVA